MKKSLLSILLTIAVLSIGVLITGCGTTSSMSGGRGDYSEIVLSSKKDFVNRWVRVIVDDNEPVEVRPKRHDVAVREAVRMMIDPGRHQVIVTDLDGYLLYSHEIFVSAGASKIIVLP